MIGTSLSHYRIKEKLGQGGMGEIYRAEDTNLSRQVAIKVLPDEFAHDAERLARFEREARALAALSHPNILAIFDFGKEAGITYAVTELLEGETLRQRLVRERLPWRKAIEVAAAVADGLAAAHGKGIIHRDIKPENVFITGDGRVKVLDFGLARLQPLPAWGEATTALSDPGTAAGTVLGTVGYMAPEQVRGQPADARSDIFTLGCLLYEMLAGKRAFARETAAETMTAILKDPAPEVSVSGIEATPELNRIIGHCLEKNPGERFQSASDLSFHLKSLLTGAAPARPSSGIEAPAAKPETPSIAVLPFANLSPDPEQEYFCDGIAEEITADLSQLQSLRVISRSSTIRMKGTQKDARTIGRELGVRYVMEGSVRKAGNRLRVTAQLIDSINDRHLWAQKYEGTLDDVFDIQEKVARSAVEALRVKLTDDESRRLGSRSIGDVRVWEVYLQARREAWLMSPASLERAMSLVKKGVSVFGESDLLLTVEALIHQQYVNLMLGPARDYRSQLQEARICAARALELNPHSGAAQLILGLVAHQSARPAEALACFKQATVMNPNDPDSNTIQGFVLAVGGCDLEGARRLLQRGVELDPLSAISRGALGWLYWFQGSYSAALSEFVDWERELESERSPFRLIFPWLYAANGNTAEALRLLDTIVADSPHHIVSAAAGFFDQALRGNEAEARAAVTQELREAACWDDYHCLLMADGYVLLGEHDEAFPWLERAIEYGFTNEAFLCEHEPFIRPLRSDPRFAALLEKAGRLRQALEEIA